MRNFAYTLFVLLIATSSFAKNYYIDATNGNDQNNGTSPNSAWQTIGRVNGANLLPSDSVLFKRGEIFRGNLFPQSGSELGYITYCDYGTGNKPKILGSIKRDAPSDWVNESGNIWCTTNKQSTDSIQTTGHELLPNPDFTTDAKSWYAWSNTANGASTIISRDTASSDYYSAPACGKLECLGSGTGISDIQLWSSGLNIQSAKWYKFSFKAKASVPFTIPAGNIKIMQNGSPYTSYSSSVSKAIDVTSNWVSYEMYFNSEATATDARVDFFLGNTIPGGTIFYVDSLSFKELERDPGFILVDVGNIIFNNESGCGIKVKNESDLDSQGEFWYDEKNSSLKIYSVANPSLFYSEIELAINQHIINENGKSYITYENLDLRYGAAHGIGGGNTHNIQAKDLDISWIGGGYLAGYGDGKVRYGNGIEFWAAAHDNIVERCKFDQIYDAALTVQGSGNAYQAYNIVFRNNIINNSEYSYEFWGHPAGTYLHEIYFENNTCMNAGFGWGHAQRPDPNGAHLMFWGYHDEQTENIFIRNNIFYNSSNYGSYFGDFQTTTKFNIDYNCWYESSGLIAVIANKKYDFNSGWNNFVTYSGKDSHSINADPLLNPDFTLSENSPCINAGTVSTVNEDFNGTKRPQSSKIDIGAFEFLYSTKSEKIQRTNEINIYPNPTNNILTIECGSTHNQIHITIMNINGQKLMDCEQKNLKSDIDISYLTSGIYLLKLQEGNHVEVKKIIKR